jgi:hypothetical protein
MEFRKAAKTTINGFKWAMNAYRVYGLIASFAGTVLFATFAVITSQTLGVQVLLWVGVVGVAAPVMFVFGGGIIGGLLLRKSPKSIAEFYDTRDDADRALGTITEVVKKTDEIRAQWHFGQGAARQDIWREGHIKRLVLTHPKAIEAVAPVYDIAPEQARGDVLYATRRAEEAAGTEVRWYDGPLIVGMLIGHPNDTKRGWARIETGYPHGHDPHVRTTTYYRAIERPKLFTNLCLSYERLSGKSGPVSLGDKPEIDQRAVLASLIKEGRSIQRDVSNLPPNDDVVEEWFFRAKAFVRNNLGPATLNWWEEIALGEQPQATYSGLMPESRERVWGQMGVWNERLEGFMERLP